MKPQIHPNYQKVVYMDVNSGFKFMSGSTKGSNETIKWEDGNTYPLIKMETTSDSHPFYTGRQKFADKGGRAERFMQKYNMQKEV
ncbi:type B 50S ribosomal protein L31 [Bacillus sp. FJAT-42376]|uniref:type B 50S ribosomal protein L31 n=1 Tax=Bacillus sp. FJAT-42376 TaxID=2014076 RepID=UPI000F4EA59C|nr:type B 50S ribosomal protein L31 [Bacillus sp. FJAT-42376]AZB44095.1 type B 50S ribosomal protein L31 [Bacillus sp. FJAT-42376]